LRPAPFTLPDLSDSYISRPDPIVFQVEDAQGVRVHELAGYSMFLPGDDHRAALFLFHPVTATTYSLVMEFAEVGLEKLISYVSRPDPNMSLSPQA
jgi:hypothetical protein